MVREKSVKSQGILFQTKSGHPDNAKPILAFMCNNLHFSSKVLYLTTSHHRP